MKRHCDLAILGGGLAGLGLAYQIKKACPGLDIVVVEKNTFPRPRAIAKVGESTVEIGSHYLARHLDLDEHLKHNHLKKFGIRLFFGEAQGDFAQQDELGASQTFGIPTYQIDRGDLENQLAAKIRDQGVEIVEAAQLGTVALAPSAAAGHQVQVQTPTDRYPLSCRWLIDATGRASVLKGHLHLAKPNEHQAHAVWFRIDRRIEIDTWTQNPHWQTRCRPQGQRWLSTNHLTGPGYWVWIIPLASGVTSIGIVMDDQAFCESGISSPDTAMAWLRRHQSRCAEAIEGARFLDFVVLQNYSYDCQQVFSDQGWGITGEAGRFADPFYSPGSDFIAFGNGFITDLVASEQRGEDSRLKTLVFEKLFRSIYDNTLSLYTGQYGGFGDRRMMGLKLLWDYTYYWGVLSLLYFRHALTDIAAIRQLSPLLQQAQTLNQDLQAQFRQRANRRLVLPSRGLFLDQYQIPCLRHFNEVLQKDEHTPCLADLQDNLHRLQHIATSVVDMLKDDASTVVTAGEKELLGDYRRLIVG